MENKRQADGFVRIAAATPPVRVADCPYNTEEMYRMIAEAAENGAAVIVFPELSVTGYTCGDLFKDRKLMESAEASLWALIERTKDLNILCAVGIPVPSGGALYNCAAMFCRGKLLALPAKQNIPNYSEFYEARHFSPASEYGMLRFGGEWYSCSNVLVELAPDVVVGVEICEDAWVADPPSVRLAQLGATIILNLSCSDEIIGKAQYRRDMLRMHSGRLLAAYAYADSGFGESTTDMIFAGHNLICENGTLLAESMPFGSGFALSEIDVGRLAFERRRINTFYDASDLGGYETVTFAGGSESCALTRPVSATPFVPEGEDAIGERAERILAMQVAGLRTRLSHLGDPCAVIGISGGLDSALALLVAARAFDALGKDRKGIVAVTMPCFGTTGRTYNNSLRLMQALGVTARTVPIADTVRSHFKDIGHDESVRNAAYENAQARVRTLVLMDIANDVGGIVVGTGDLSELALGWATYNGDHMSMYGVNASVPKTLVKYLIRSEAKRLGGEAEKVLRDILDTEISPELLPPEEGKIAQKTEELVGPYELHDFFLYYAIRWGFSPSKVYFLAKYAFAGRYEDGTVKKWLVSFYRRFFSQQFKRSCLPDGVKVGSVTLSPRGDWRMPSDAVADLWLQEAEGLK